MPPANDATSDIIDRYNEELCRFRDSIVIGACYWWLIESIIRSGQSRLIVLTPRSFSCRQFHYRHCMLSNR
jgi:hypothetical protein